jgi:membrane protein
LVFPNSEATMNWRNGWTLLKEAVKEFSEDDAMTQAAALAFYSALGLAPTILLFLSVSAFLGEGATQSLIAQVEGLIGGKGAEAIGMVVQSAREQPSGGSFAAVVSIVTVLVSASGIFAQLQSALNRIWNVKPAPGGSWWMWIRRRLLSVGMLFSLLFLLLVSLVASAAVSLLFGGTGVLWNLLNLVVSVAIFSVLFALIYRFLPDAEMVWRDVWVGAVLTAVLFGLGKDGIGLYLGQSSLASSYGAAGSMIVLLAWVYYSAVIVLFGAEVTQVYARCCGSGIRPADHAMPADADAPNPNPSKHADRLNQPVGRP